MGDRMSIGQPYSFGIYTVKQGKEKEFIDTWNKFVDWSLGQYKVASTPVRLVQDQDNPRRFIAFAEWINHNDLQSWMQKPEFNEYLNKFRELCDDVERIFCKVTVDIPVAQRMHEEVRSNKGR